MQTKRTDLITEKDYATAGYEVRPGSNGGFVIFYGSSGGPLNQTHTMPNFAAVSSERDLMYFLASVHGVEISVNGGAE